MNDLVKIVNLKKHPINTVKYMNLCSNELKKQSILKLENFLTLKTIKSLQNEAKNLHKKAYYCSQSHTIFLKKKSVKLPINDPCNIEVKSDKGCVPHDKIPKKSILNKLYKSKEFKSFIKGTLNVPNIYPYKDKLSSINYNYYEKTQQLGWHFDNATFAITLMIASSNRGGIFEYIIDARNFEKNYVNRELIKKI